MDFDIHDDILCKVNRWLMRNDCKILLLLDNAPCHPYDMKGHDQDIKIVFLLLDLGIIQGEICQVDDDPCGEQD